MMRRHCLIGIHDKNNLILQSLGMMHCCQSHAIRLLFALFSGLLSQLFCIFFNMSKPFLIRRIIPGTILKFIQQLN